MIETGGGARPIVAGWSPLPYWDTIGDTRRSAGCAKSKKDIRAETSAKLQSGLK